MPESSLSAEAEADGEDEEATVSSLPAAAADGMPMAIMAAITPETDAMPTAVRTALRLMGSSSGS